MIQLYELPSAMEPMLPADNSELNVLAIELIRKSAALSHALHPISRKAVSQVVKPMNSYYSNLIEGHNTHPLDIERALKKDYSQDPGKRILQLESKAHIEVQESLEERLREEPDINICSFDFISWIHKEFYKNLPDEFRFVKTKEGKTSEVIPGEMRKGEVEIGAHIAPASKALSSFLARFEQVYRPDRITDPVRRIIAAAASHHRLAWIHPFLDGNGRVMRLYTHAFMIREQLDGEGLWSISRGFSKRQELYRAALHNADQQRYNDYDGRGNLSNKGLVEFCKFFLETAIDQVDFMKGLLDLDDIQQRIIRFIDLQKVQGKFKEESKYVLLEVFLKGQVYRKEMERITGKSENTARKIMKELIDQELLVSDDATGPVRMNFPVKYVGYFFPKLYPDNIEATLDRIV
jgi:Fic family protein